MRDITLGITFYHDFTTRAFATGIPTVLSGTPVLSVLEENNATPITAGVSVSVDRASVVGLNEATIVATGGNGYEAGKSYSIYISTGTVGGVSVVGEVVGQFTVGQGAAAVDLANGTDGLGAIKTDTAASLTDTDELQSVLSAGILARSNNATLETLLGVDDDASEDTLPFQNWEEILTGATHNQATSAGRILREAGGLILHSGTMQAGSGVNTAILDTGASTVDDFFRFAKVVTTGGTAADQEAIISSYVGATRVATITPAWRTTPDVTTEFVVLPATSHAETLGGGYEGGAVWLDTIDGSAGTQLYVNGTVDNPSDNVADARTIADALGMHVFHSVPGTSFTLAQTFNNFEFIGAGYTINLGSQDIGGTRFIGGAITGIGTGSVRAVFRECILPAGATLPVCTLLVCNLSSSTLVLSAASTYNFNGCVGNLTILDFGAAVGNTTVNVHDFDGRIQVENMGDSGTDAIVVDGVGEFIEGTCTGGTARLAGTMSISGITNLIVTDPARIDLAGINAEVDTGISDAALATAANLATVDTNVDSILVDTNELQTDWTDGGRLDLILDAILADTNELQSDDIPTLIAALNDLSAANVLTEVNTALDTAISELAQAAPTATPSIRTGLMLLYMALRNRTDVQTSGTDALEIYNNAGTRIAQKLITDDGSDYSEAEMISGA